MTHRSSAFALPMVLVALTGCAGYGPTDHLIGQDRAAIVAQMGPPTNEFSEGAVTRLEYARGPFGRHTYFIELDSDGRVKRWEQVLNWKNFERIKPGMTQKEVRLLIGQSFEVTQLARHRGEVWSYRYESPPCIWFQIEFTQEGTVRSAGDGIPPECLRRIP